jgi:hypothetical protein
MAENPLKARMPSALQMAVFEAIRSANFPEVARLLAEDAALDPNPYLALGLTPAQSRDVKLDILRRIETSRPHDLRHLTDEHRRFYVALASIYELWGRTDARRFLRVPLVEAEPHLMCARLLWVSAVSSRNLDQMRDAGVAKARLSATSSACAICVSDSDIIYPLDEVPALPHPGCQCDGGCQCRLLAVLDE